MKTRLLSRQRQEGFSLVEVLVSVVIMSVGILGIAGLQMLSLQQNRSSLFRADALLLGGDILDRMRANPLQNYAGLGFTDEPPMATDCVDQECTVSQMKDYDIALWRCSINHQDVSNASYPSCDTLLVTGSLPGGQGAIVNNDDDALCAVETGETCVIVRWIDDPDPSGTTYTSVTLRTRTD
jgi:type IV pilus assembly protein PilV